MANNLFNETEASYQRLIAAVSVTEAFASQGNAFETSQAVRKILAALYTLGQCYKQLEQNFMIFDFIAKVEKRSIDGFNVKLANVWPYIHAPETFLAEAYLVSAEKALISNDMYCVANAYKRIKPGENLRKLLDAQDSSQNNLKERAGKLDQLVCVMQNSQSGMASD